MITTRTRIHGPSRPVGPVWRAPIGVNDIIIVHDD